MLSCIRSLVSRFLVVVKNVLFIAFRFLMFCDFTVIDYHFSGCRSVPLIEISPRLWLMVPVIVDSCRRLMTRGRALPYVLIMLRGDPPLFSR